MKTFACIADAVATYYSEGYITTKECSGFRIMSRGNSVIRIMRIGFLFVAAF